MSWPALGSHRVPSQHAVRVAATRLETPVNAIRRAMAHYTYSAPIGLRPTSLIPNVVPRRWMRSA